MDNIKAQQAESVWLAVRVELNEWVSHEEVEKKVCEFSLSLSAVAAAHDIGGGIGKLHYFYMLNNIQDLSSAAVYVVLGRRRKKG